MQEIEQFCTQHSWVPVDRWPPQAVSTETTEKEVLMDGGHAEHSSETSLSEFRRGREGGVLNKSLPTFSGAPEYLVHSW